MNHLLKVTAEISEVEAKYSKTVSSKLDQFNPPVGTSLATWLPLDSTTLPEAERKARLRRHFPGKPKPRTEETFEGIDLDTYKRFWKK
ncbi:hypothetical protein WISP_54989 [Willisornis vidua]|uniref:RM55 protein n=1 Tax=Willisornis vidua TaxID=1566151 RepID=A0ABQ9DD19_9PASS|nr:hypothetical protein WISP_54989 [Willisornis vidua]